MKNKKTARLLLFLSIFFFIGLKDSFALSNKIHLELNMPQDINVGESFDVYAIYLYDNKIITNEKSIELFFPEGFISKYIYPIPNKKGEYYTRVIGPSKNGEYPVELSVSFPENFTLSKKIVVLTKEGFIEAVPKEYRKSPIIAGALTVFPGIVYPGVGYDYAGESYMAFQARNNRLTSTQIAAVSALAWLLVSALPSRVWGETNNNIRSVGWYLYNPGVYMFLGDWLYEIFNAPYVTREKTL